MKLFASPLQGYTDSAWRRAHNEIFGGVDAYVAPFVRVERGEVRRREWLDISPERNTGVNVVPQLLAGRPTEVEKMLEAIAQHGYRHVNVNLGCPHPPIVKHGRGAGLLANPDNVAAMFDTLAHHSEFTFSIKMRLGVDDPQQWRAIAALLPRLNPTAVAVHVRTATQQYRGEALKELLPEVVETINFPVVYNGDITSPDEVSALARQYPTLAGVMIGRALVADPALLTPNRAIAENYRRFHQALFEAYSTRLTGGDHQLLAKLHSLWEYFLPNADRRARKAIKKANSIDRYAQATEQLFSTL